MFQRDLYFLERELTLRGYSKKTIKSYTLCVREYFLYAKSEWLNINESKIKSFLLKKHQKGLAPNTVNLYLNAIKFYYREVVKSNKRISLKFSKRRKKLPVVLSKSEIKDVINIIKNPKHKLLISLAYGAGLRVSEVVKLKLKDLYFEEGLIKITNPKGGKDRFTLLPQKLEWSLQNFTENLELNDYIFPSSRGGRLSERTAQKIFICTLKKSNVKKEATFHSLRHSFATHLLENGTDIRYIQKLLGHQNIRTTQIYTQVATSMLQHIKSPL